MAENYRTGVNVEYYKPLFKDFLNENKELLIQSKYPYGIFIPYVFPNYHQAPVKIFYVGRDTDCWGTRDDMLDCYNENNIEKYFEINQSHVTVEDALLRWGNGSGAYWSFVNKLHLYIRTGEVKNLTNLNENEIEILKEVGYGNMNCMELKQTLLKKYWPWEFDFDKLDSLRQESLKLDRISHIVKAYKPDIIVILTWSGKEEDYLDIEHTWHEEYFKHNIHSVFSLQGYNTKVIWSSHPNRFSRLGENQESMVHELGDLILNFLNK